MARPARATARPGRVSLDHPEHRSQRVLDAIKSIGTGIDWCDEAGPVAAARAALDRRHRARLRHRLHACRLRTAVVAALTMLCVGLCGFWDLTMITLAIMLVAVALAMLIGVPLGIWAGLSDRAERRLRPVLDTAQVMPAYVYLIPCVAFFGIGVPAAVVATLIFAVAPAVRLTSLGLRQVPVVSTEVGRSFGSTGQQLLGKVQLPLARQDGPARPQPGDHDGLRHRRDRLADRHRRCRRSGAGRDCRSSTPSWRSRPASASCSRPSPSTGSPPASAAPSTASRTTVWVVDRRRMWIAALPSWSWLRSAAVVFGVEDFPSWRIGIGSWAKSAIDWLNENVPTAACPSSVAPDRSTTSSSATCSTRSVACCNPRRGGWSWCSSASSATQQRLAAGVAVLRCASSASRR